MILVEIFSREDCHLCEKAKAALRGIQRRHPFELRETIIREGDAMFEGMKERVPVVHINGSYAFHYRIPEGEFISRLESAARDSS